MPQRSYFFDSVNADRLYSSADLANVLARLIGRDGVVFGYGGQLAVSPGSGLAVQVATGAAWVQGRLLEVYNTAESLALAPADPTYDRIDRVVVRLDLSTGERRVYLAVKTGTPAATPSPPALQRDGTVWELSLAQVWVRAGATSVQAGDVTDERADEAVCGYTPDARDERYVSGVSGFASGSVKAALDALAGVQIVEMGGNGNGEYVRWANGLQICWHLNAINADTFIWTYPAAFVVTPVVQTTLVRTKTYGPFVASPSNWSVTSTQTEVTKLYWNGTWGPAGSEHTHLLAIGRWK